jgi:hypothetical protein
MIRQATLADMPAILLLARQLATTYYPRLKWDPSRSASQLRAAISSARHFAQVGEHTSGAIASALIAVVNDGWWHQRCASAVLLWTSSVPGQGSKLLREYRTWCDSRAIIKVSGFSPDCDVDSRVWLLAGRLGYKLYGGAYLRYRGDDNGTPQENRQEREARLQGREESIQESLEVRGPGDEVAVG